MFYDPTPPLSSSWSEWSGRMNRPGHYEDIEWSRPLGDYSRSYSSPRIRRIVDEMMEESPRMSRTNSRSDAETSPEIDEQEREGRPPRVHRIPIMVESRGEFQSDSRPGTPDSINMEEREFPRFSDPEPPISNTIPRVRRRNFEQDDDERDGDIQRSRSHTTGGEPRFRRFVNRAAAPERKRNVTRVRVNCEEETEKPKVGSLADIEAIVKEVDELKKQVESLTEIQNKLYRYLDEMLTRCMLKLDDIDTMGAEDIRLARKNAIGKVQSCIDLLEYKVHPPKNKNSEKIKPETSTKITTPEAEKPVIVLPFHEPQTTKQETSNKNNPETNKTVIVLPFYDKEQESKNGVVEEKKTVIVLPYRENAEKESKIPEKTLIVLPYGENESQGIEQDSNVIPLPFHEDNQTSNGESESLCTKL